MRGRYQLLAITVLATGLSAADLEPHRILEQPLSPGQKTEYSLSATSGQYIHLVVRQMGVEVAISVVDPNGKTVLEAARNHGAYGPQSASFIASVSGAFRIAISSPARLPGRYQIELVELRNPTTLDRSQIEAETLIFEAYREGKKQHALELYRDAFTRWMSLGNAYEAALTCYARAEIHSDLREPRKALELYQQALTLQRTAGDRSGEAATLNGIGNAYADLNQKQKALDYYAQSLTIRHALGDRIAEANTLSNIGDAHYSLNDRTTALSYYNQALALDRDAGDQSGESESLLSLARIYLDLGDRSNADDCHKRAIELQRSLGGHGEEDTLYAIGLDYLRRGDRQKAEDYFEPALALKRSHGDHVGEYAILNDSALAYFALGQTQKALDYLKQALPLEQSAGDHHAEASTLANLGNIDFVWGERQQALSYFDHALSVARAAADAPVQITALTLLATRYANSSEGLKALECLNQALALAHVSADRSSEAAILASIGRVENSLGQTVVALKYLNQALALNRANADRASESATLSSLGSLNFAGGDRRKALQFYNEALRLERAGTDRAGEAGTLFSIGTAYSAKGERQSAREYYDQALKLIRVLGDRASEATILDRIGRDCDALGLRQEAIGHLTEELRLNRSIGSRTAESNTLAGLGNIYFCEGDRAKAQDFYDQALALDRAMGDRASESATLAAIGNVYSTRGEKQKALDYLTRSLALSRETGYHVGEAATLASIGLVYSALNDKQKALDYLNQSLAMKRALHDRTGESAVLTNLANIYSIQGDKPKALQFLNQALALERTSGDLAGEAATLSSIGYLYFSPGQTGQALSYLNQALTLQRTTGDRPGQSYTLSAIGYVYSMVGDTRKALEFYGQALPLQRAVSDRFNEAYTLSSVSYVLSKSQPKLAILFAKQSVNLFQTLRQENRSLEDSLRKTFERSIEFYYRALAGLLVDQQRFGEAEEILDLLKDKEAADFVRRDAIADQLRPATLLESERKALDRYEEILAGIVPKGQAKSELVAKAAQTPLTTAESQQSKQLDQDLAAANTVLLRYIAEQEKTFAPTSAAAKRVGELRESEGLQDTLQALGPDVVAIYTLVLPDKYIALLVTSGARKVYSTAISETELNRRIFDFRQQLQNPASNPLPLAQELYRILFPEGLRQDLDSIGAKTIMWSIDSTLRYLPIAALHDGQQYLVAHFRNSLITPASLTRLNEAAQSAWRGVGFGVSQAKGNFSALPSVPEELGRIFRSGETGTGPIPGQVRLDPDFTRETFEAAMRQPEKAVVHIATHFDSQPGVAANSNLLLGDGTEISLAEIEAMPRLFSGVELLTLSACSTAFTNANEDGREVDSFGTIAQRLGAKGVIASLWNVNDDATAVLMETMYRIRQAQPSLGKNEALRQAQQQMANGTLKPSSVSAKDRAAHRPGEAIRSKGWEHPYYWAPFILIGNWK